MFFTLSPYQRHTFEWTLNSKQWISKSTMTINTYLLTRVMGFSDWAFRAADTRLRSCDVSRGFPVDLIWTFGSTIVTWWASHSDWNKLTLTWLTPLTLICIISYNKLYDTHYFVKVFVFIKSRWVLHCDSSL
jgi:hypothetical protein